MAASTRALLSVLAPLPALVVGVLVMRRSDVSPSIWGTQLAAGLTLIILCFGLTVFLRRTSPARPWPAAMVGSAALLLLISTLVHPGVDGVRRWVSLGPLQLHAAFI